MPEANVILSRLGIDGVDGIEPVSGGADATLYRVRRGDETLALRVLGPTQQHQAEVENQYLAHTTSHGIAGPRLIATGIVDECPVSVMTWIEGQPLAHRLLSGEAIGDLPEQFAQWHRRIHALPLVEQPDTSIPWRHMLPEDLIAALGATEPRPPVVVHLDYHPFNCMERDGQIVAVLDWANACIADPRYDVARTFTILTHAPVQDPTLVADFTRRYILACSDDPLPPVFRWWAGVTMLNDLLPKRGHPALGWLTDSWIAGVTAWTEAARRETIHGT